jgi:6-phosphogluconolactonase
VLPRIHRFASEALLLDALYTGIGTLASATLEQRGRFSIILAGGNTPRALYQRLRHLETDWRRWHIYFSDERCLAAGHPDRNDSMASNAWLDHVAIPAAQIHRVPAGEDAVAAASAYSAVLSQAPGFDLALLGLGEDGHTASLFPGDRRIESGAELAIGITDAPKPPLRRVSLSAGCLSSAEVVWFIVTGEAKRQALKAWLDGAPLPAQWIRPRAGVDLFTDVG